MKLLFDTFPVLLFVAIYYGTRDIFLATAVAIAGTVVQMGVFWARHRRFENMHLISAALIFVLGGLTIVLRDKSFIMWKPTIVNWLFALVFLGPQLLGKKTLFERMAGHAISVPATIWNRANLMWVAFFLAAGAANIHFALAYQGAEAALMAALPTLGGEAVETLDCARAAFAAAPELCQSASAAESAWVNFKFALIAITFAFVLLLGIYLARHMEKEDDDQSLSPEER